MDLWWTFPRDGGSAVRLLLDGRAAAPDWTRDCTHPYCSCCRPSAPKHTYYRLAKTINECSITYIMRNSPHLQAILVNLLLISTPATQVKITVDG